MRRLTLVASGATPAQRQNRFPLDDEGVEPLPEPAARTAVASLAPFVRSEARHGPERRCAETAEALGVSATALAEAHAWDLGVWTGRAIVEVATDEPEGFAAWRTDPDAAPHGGESLHAFVGRVGTWMDHGAAAGPGVLAVVDGSVARAALVHALGAPWTVFWRIDVVPLSVSLLTHGRGEWRVRSMAAPMVSGGEQDTLDVL